MIGLQPANELLDEICEVDESGRLYQLVTDVFITIDEQLKTTGFVSFTVKVDDL